MGVSGVRTVSYPHRPHSALTTNHRGFVLLWPRQPSGLSIAWPGAVPGPMTWCMSAWTGRSPTTVQSQGIGPPEVTVGHHWALAPTQPAQCRLSP